MFGHLTQSKWNGRRLKLQEMCQFPAQGLLFSSIATREDSSYSVGDPLRVNFSMMSISWAIQRGYGKDSIRLPRKGSYFLNLTMIPKFS